MGAGAYLSLVHRIENSCLLPEFDYQTPVLKRIDTDSFRTPIGRCPFFCPSDRLDGSKLLRIGKTCSGFVPILKLPLTCHFLAIISKPGQYLR